MHTHIHTHTHTHTYTHTHTHARTHARTHVLKRSMQRGFVKRRVGRPEEALEDLKRAVSLDAKSREAHNHLGMALLDAGHLEQVNICNAKVFLKLNLL